ncbi:hypothetical protein G6F46_004385 [Rhizopus delemar]|uniref:Tc1-like transposase DDE domain-containing protein n=2 Tax=Rhizopus TaxID=4842 RepID=A0A9P6Z5H7_9FUNG|nr:hypothetical protein G6F55_006819 [Rhizopus delemar]KAG1540976.1 hypothetical protein G6F51_008189 [Rhizopus arrhizus]KAG1502538.1 hypothetical protein G6F54_002297 [Rhizopus delemar]KAG1509071.1 hypothetical protein G6F53_007722 [Rhizopus delemar]KAG1524680.1 hypothetical protein G6F52_003995 [Rhizopus delemar]
MDYLTNRVFVDESGFNINMRSPNARSIRGAPAFDVISVEIREPLKPKKIKVDGGRQRKKPVVKKKAKGTVTGHYRMFISKNLDEMDKFPELRNFYVVMNNALIHISEDITQLIEARGYRAIDLPLYSPELNPIENFWSVIKNSVKQSAFQEAKDLKTRISEASESVSRKTFHNIAQHSVNNF